MATVDEEVKLTQADLDTIKTQETDDINASNTMYDDMYQDAQDSHTDITNAITANRDAQEKIANESYEFAIDKIEQGKTQARKDYIKEQSGAYVDYQKAIDPYGANAEGIASRGLAGSGFSESSRVSMHNTYQNRVATARANYQLIVQNYNNAMTEAKLQNSSVLAQIAAETLEKQLEADLTFLQMGQSILTQKADAAFKIKQTARSNWMDVYNSIQSRRQFEETMAENKRQFEETMAENKRQFDNTLAAKYGSGTILEDNTEEDNTESGGSSKSSSRGGRTSRVQKNTQTEEDKKPTTKSKAYAEVKDVRIYDDAKSLLASYGIKPSETGMPLLTSGNWYKAKRTGEFGSALEGIDSYEEYLQYYCTWAIKNYA